jgi:hypothetical protein
MKRWSAAGSPCPRCRAGTSTAACSTPAGPTAWPRTRRGVGPLRRAITPPSPDRRRRRRPRGTPRGEVEVRALAPVRAGERHGLIEGPTRLPSNFSRSCCWLSPTSHIQPLSRRAPDLLVADRGDGDHVAAVGWPTSTIGPVRSSGSRPVSASPARSRSGCRIDGGVPAVLQGTDLGVEAGRVGPRTWPRRSSGSQQPFSPPLPMLHVLRPRCSQQPRSIVRRSGREPTPSGCAATQLAFQVVRPGTVSRSARRPLSSPDSRFSSSGRRPGPLTAAPA